MERKPPLSNGKVIAIAATMSAAAIALGVGLKPGTVITEINGKSVADLRDFAAGLKESDFKKGVRLEILTDGSKKFEVLRTGE